MLLPIQRTLGWEWRHQYIRPLKHISVCSKTCIVKMYSIHINYMPASNYIYTCIYPKSLLFLQDLGQRADKRSKHKQSPWLQFGAPQTYCRSYYGWLINRPNLTYYGLRLFRLQSWFNSFGQSGTLEDWAMFGQLLQKLPRHQSIPCCRVFLLTFLTSTLDLPLQLYNNQTLPTPPHIGHF